MMQRTTFYGVAMRCPTCDALCPTDVRSCPGCGVAFSRPEDSRATLVSPEDSPLAASLLEPSCLAEDETDARPDIPGYRIVRKLGEGGMGVVYLAQQVELGRKVALKILAPGLARDRSLIERFRREARLLARVHHPSIVSIHELLEQDGRFCIVMHYVDGGTLKQRIRAGALPGPLAVDLCCQAARGLWAAAQQGLVHRDIKPDNLLIDAQNRLKIGDFGLAKAAEESSGLTRTGSMMGTPAYMPPEQWNDGRQTDHRSDLYALGCTLFEMLAGHPPFRGPTTANFTKQHCLNPAPDLRDSCADVHPALAGIVARLLAKDPALRFQTGEQLAEALENLDAQPVAPRGERPRRPRAWVALIGAVLAVLLGLLMMQNAGDAPSQDPNTEPAPAPVDRAQQSRARGLLKTVDQHLNNAQYLTSPEDRLRRQDWLEQALAASEQAVELAPELADSHFYLGRCYQAREQWDRALEAFDKALACDPGHHEALYRRILGLHAELNQQAMGSPVGNAPEPLKRMREDLERLLLLDVPEDWIATARGLVAYGELGERLSEALTDADLAVDLWRTLADELETLGEAVLAANPGNPWGHVLLNWAASNQALADQGGLGGDLSADQWIASIQHMERAVNLQPNAVYFRQQLVWMYLAAGRDAEAEQYAQETVAVAPLSSHSHSLLGNVLLRLGHDAEGWQSLDKALELAAHICPIRVSRAMAHLGDPVTANNISYWQPTDSQYHAALQELDAALDEHPDEFLSLWIKGNLLWLSCRDIPGGIEIFARLADLTPESFIGKMSGARAVMPSEQHPLEQWRMMNAARYRLIAGLPEKRGLLLGLLPSWRARIELAEDLDAAQRKAALQQALFWEAAMLACEERPAEAIERVDRLLQTGWRDWPALDAESAFVTLRADSTLAVLRTR